MVVLGFLGLYGKYKNWDQFAVVGFVMGALFILTIAIFVPKVLASPNRWYLSFGKAIGKIVSPIVLGGIFFLMITPVGYIGRLLNRDELKLKRFKGDSYWLDNDAPAISAESFKIPY